MPTPTTGSAASSVPFTGDDLIDALLIGEKWGGGVGTGFSVTYSFPNFDSFWSTNPSIGYGSQNSGQEPWDDDYRGLDPTEQNAVRVAMQAWGAVANINPVETNDNENVVGDIRIAFTSGGFMDADTYAYAYTPDSNAPYAGDVWLNPFPPEPTGNDFSIGAAGYATIIHELGHALGLTHPFPEDDTDPIYVPAQFDSFKYTVMSYSDRPGHIDTAYSSFYPTTPMLLDIQALQYLYGANMTYHTGNDVYTFQQGGDYYQTIWDADGSDTIRYSATTDGALIDLRAGKFSQLGDPITLSDGSLQHANVAIAYGVRIEKAFGGSGPDKIIGNLANNVLRGSGGRDTVQGGAGNDNLAGGLGYDRLTGQDGGDSFTFDAALIGKADRIVDFSIVDDTIRLDNDIFTAFAGANVGLSGGAFYGAPGATDAHDATDRIIYDTTTGNLYYDPDGTGAAPETPFAMLAGAPSVTAADFFIVA